MPGTGLRAARANHVFRADEKHIRTENMVMQLLRNNCHIHANVFVILVAASGRAMKFVVCVSREGFGDFSADDLTLGRLYEVVTPADKLGMVRIIDDSGEDYLYPAPLFDAVEVQDPTAARLHALLAA